MIHTPFKPENRVERTGIVQPWTALADRPDAIRLAETQGLVEALGCTLAFTRNDRVRKPTSAYWLSTGHLEQLCADVKETACSLIVMDTSLSPVQQRNLEQRLGVKVIDRTGLILEIFSLRARSAEGRLQVELARLSYERSRLVRTWTHLERQRGGRGFLGGPGETQLEADKRMIDRTLARLRKKLQAVRRTRRVQRTARQRRHIPVIALVGYTNTGKSSLFNRLTGANTMVRDMPFATLDTTIRKMIAKPGPIPVLLVDTVGFIRDLPTHLVDSFEATLQEALEADILVHVRDRSTEADDTQKRDVLRILNHLCTRSDTPLPPIIEAWNKIDKLDKRAQKWLEVEANRAEESMDKMTVIPVSALNGHGLNKLCTVIKQQLAALRSPTAESSPQFRAGQPYSPAEENSPKNHAD